MQGLFFLGIWHALHLHNNWLLQCVYLFNMFPVQYAYLILGLLLLLVWLLFFFLRKDVRREMMLTSLIFGIGGVLAEHIYVRDWWHPLTVTGTQLGFEDFLFGFTTGGVASVVYEVLFRRRLGRTKSKRLLSQTHLIDAFIILLLSIIFFGGTIFFGLNTLQASLIGYGTPILLMYYRRPDLIADSLISGVSLLAIIFVIYTILGILCPGWISSFWAFKNVPPLIFLNVPIDDLIWYLFTGAYIGILYEFFRESPLFRLK
jgi:hypothetical protein